jgi:hypothetical protein
VHLDSAEWNRGCRALGFGSRSGAADTRSGPDRGVPFCLHNKVTITISTEPPCLTDVSPCPRLSCRCTRGSVRTMPSCRHAGDLPDKVELGVPEADLPPRQPAESFTLSRDVNSTPAWGVLK